MNMKRTCGNALSILGSLVMLGAVAPAWAQTTITGRVLSEQGQELGNANVYINQLGISVATNAAGRYTIVIPEGRATGQSVSVGVRVIYQGDASRRRTHRRGSEASRR